MSQIGTNVSLAASLLKEGRLVGMPTETVYGLAADASNAQALSRLFEAKGRPKSHPVIVHLSSVEQLEEWASVIPPLAKKLAARFWPGPLTMILPKHEHVLEQVTGGQDTVAIRIPRHPVALQLLREFGGGLAAPSANRFGKLSPTRAEDVLNEFGDAVSYILDGGTCQVGIESTIIDLSGDAPQILRPGMIGAVDLEPFFSESGTRFKDHPHHSRLSFEETFKTRAPGTLKSHYSPHTPLRLVDGPQLFDVLKEMSGKNLKPAVLAFQAQASAGQAPKAALGKPEITRAWIVADSDPKNYARTLYANLRKLDACGCDWIVVEQVPETDNWSAIRDRLNRASYKERSGTN